MSYADLTIHNLFIEWISFALLLFSNRIAWGIDTDRLTENYNTSLWYTGNRSSHFEEIGPIVLEIILNLRRIRCLAGS